MAQLYIKNVNSRDKIRTLSSLSSAERAALNVAVDACKPQFLVEAVANPPSGFGDVGVYFNVEKGRTYALRSEALINSADPDPIQISAGITAQLTQIGMSAGGGSDAAGDGILVENATTFGRVGLTFAPTGANPPKWVVATTMFRADEAATLSIQVESSTTILLEPGTNFTLYEISKND